MFQLFREILKPAVSYLGKAEYREWIAVKSACRKKMPRTPVTLNIAGFTVSGPDALSFLHQYEEIFVRRAFDIEFKKKDPVIFCCGANIGLEIFFFKKRYPDCKIKAFEADPEIAAVLAKNVTENKLNDVEVISAAAWDEEGKITFEPDGALGGKAGKGTTEIPSVRLAYHLNKEAHIDLLLIDIEGAETKVLADCKEQLSKVENLFVEWHGPDKEKQNLDELLLLLTASGFRYRLNNKLPEAPFIHHIIEGGFDAMVEIYAQKK
ncbi:MAG: FkbM family methyltransferase [Bacteroidota bacterium]|nr:FkbM family methyltransferase [Bacteroidota bacterium]